VTKRRDRPSVFAIFSPISLQSNLSLPLFLSFSRCRVVGRAPLEKRSVSPVINSCSSIASAPLFVDSDECLAPIRCSLITLFVSASCGLWVSGVSVGGDFFLGLLDARLVGDRWNVCSVV